MAESADLTRMLVALAAMTQVDRTDAAPFPGRYLRTLLADFIRMYELAGANS